MNSTPPETGEELRTALMERYLNVNGEYPMSSEDDAYVDQHYVSLDALARAEQVDADAVRRLMLAGRVPLPSYLRSDGTEMVPRDLLRLSNAAGGIEQLPAWFQAQFRDQSVAAEAWGEYLSGQFVCLREVTPANIERKDALCNQIGRLIEEPDPRSGKWLSSLHELVDELDALEPPFAPYDRLRFGGPVSRDQLIVEVRRRFPLQRAESDATPVGG